MQNYEIVAIKTRSWIAKPPQKQASEKQVATVAQAMDLKDNQTKARIFAKMLEKIPSEYLDDYFAFMYGFLEKYVSKDLAFMRAYRAFRRGLFFQFFAKGWRFNSVSELQRECIDMFKGEKITANVGGWLPYVDFSIDEIGNVINNENHKPLSSGDEADFWQWLFDHQESIGQTQHISKNEHEQRERIKEQERIKAEYQALMAKQTQRNANKEHLMAKFSGLCIKVG